LENQDVPDEADTSKYLPLQGDSVTIKRENLKPNVRDYEENESTESQFKPDVIQRSNNRNRQKNLQRLNESMSPSRAQTSQKKQIKKDRLLQGSPMSPQSGLSDPENGTPGKSIQDHIINGMIADLTQG
jgi:hypothetical protein